mgnify:CR=1 FL=1
MADIQILKISTRAHDLDYLWSALHTSEQIVANVQDHKRFVFLHGLDQLRKALVAQITTK